MDPGGGCMSNTVINLKRLTILLNDLQIMTGMGISFWHSEGVKCVAQTSNVPSRFCHALQKVPALRAECNQCETDALGAARSDLCIHTFCCHAGLDECVCPVAYNGKLLGYFMIGQVRIAGVNEMLPAGDRVWRRMGLDEELMQRLYHELPVITRERYAAAMRMLETLTGFVYLEKVVRQVELPLIARLNIYIENNIARTLSLKELSREMGVSNSTICHTIRSEAGTTLTKLVNKKRVEKAVALLEEGIPLVEASRKVGFSSPSYCSRVFMQLMGIRPSTFLEKKNPHQAHSLE
jgi:AraC-like DNA-binding protein